MSDWLVNVALAWALKRWRDVLPYVLARADEKSTWLAIFTWLAVQAHFSSTPALQDAFVQFGLAVTALLGIVLKSPTFGSHSNNGAST